MPSEMPVVAVTGAGGFIGRNLVARLCERGFPVRPITHDTGRSAMSEALAEADVVVHLAGANRPTDPDDFWRVNRDYTQTIAEAVAAAGQQPLVIFASSTKASEDSGYGRSKAAGEDLLVELAARGEARVAIYRLPNVFGKWARPDYNSAVATFCHNIARGLPIRIDDPQAALALLYIEDLMAQWLSLIADPAARTGLIAPARVYRTTVGAVAAMIRRFADGETGAGKTGAGKTGEGLDKALVAALHATFRAAAVAP